MLWNTNLVTALPSKTLRPEAARTCSRGRLKASFALPGRIDGETREAMCLLFSRYFVDVTRPAFERDLADKQRVILLHDPADGTLRGFSTLQSYDMEVGGRRIRVVYSGDTIIHPDYWGQTALHRAFFWHSLRQKLTHPLTPLYWFLITKGYKTYLLLSRNFPEHWPRRELPIPNWQQQIIDCLARAKFGPAYHAERGVIRFEHPAGRLRDGVAPIDNKLLDDPDIRFFVGRNPGHSSGDELCCLGRIDVNFALSYSVRLVRRSLRALG